MQFSNLYRLAFYIAVPFAAGLAGTWFTIQAIPEWYSFLAKPFFAPPNWLFAPVWTLLYLLMGVAAYRAASKKTEMKPYWIQLGLNALWTPVFFGLRSPILALPVILLLLAAIVLTIQTFYKTDKPAAYLLLPYLAWVGFATLLNAAIMVLN